MITLFRWLMRLFLALCAVALAAVLLVYYMATRSLPDYDADYSVAAISGPVDILRDSSNVPHIYADAPEDIYFGLGFAHAQDRLWQMILARRTAQGRLSEIFGAETLQTDDFMRRLDLAGLSRDALQYQTQEVKDALSAYAAGVNAWLRIVQRDARGRGAPELFLFTPQIAPWTPADSLTILRLTALQNNTALRDEVLRAQVSLTVASERIHDILPDAPGVARTSLRDLASLFPNAPNRVASTASKTPFDPIAPRQFARGSNAWAANGSRAATGRPLLATDPHMGLTAPAPMMLAHLGFGNAEAGGGVIGSTIPGIPAILMGRSDAIAWGLTTAHLDDLDIFLEELNPENPAEYRTAEGFTLFRTKSVVIEVKDAPAVTRELRWTQNGPVIPPEHYELGTITPPGHVMSIRWTALEAIDQSMTSTINLMRARSVAAARAAVAFHKAPAWNLILADNDSVMFQMIGRQPDRNTAHENQGRIPARGWIAENHWQGIKAFEDNVFVQDPTSGIVISTNNKFTDAAFPDHVTYSWGDTQRIKRAERLLNSRRVHTRDSFIEAQLDIVSPSARILLPLIGRELWFQDGAVAEGTVERQRQIALELLGDWNGEMGRHIPEPLLYAAWMRQLQRRLIADDLGPLTSRFASPDPVFLERVFRDVDGAASWCDIRQSSRIETCDDIARQALDAAILEQTALYGDRIDSWQWGQAHQAIHAHETLGAVPLLSWIANIRQETAGGDNTLAQARTTGSGPEPFANVYAATYRAVIDFSDLDSSLHILSTGQSGHPLSRHYDDLAALWRRGEYVLMSLDPDLARAGSVGTTRLTPEP